MREQSHLAWIAASMLLAGCTPELTTPGGVDEVVGDYVAPENSWKVCDTPPAGLEGEGFSKGEVIPDVRGLDQFGDEVSLWQFHGCVVAVDISTGWCGPCRLLAQEVDEVQHDYDSQGFVYVTLMPENEGGTPPEPVDLMDWSEDWEVSGPIVGDQVGWSYEVVPAGSGTFPAVLVVGRDGVITNDGVTPTEDSAIRSAIEAAL